MATTYSKELGGRIREAREAAGLKLRELARISGVSPSYLCEIEAGDSEPSASKIQKIAKALKTKIERLLPAA